ncbi:hypothetical protein MLD38_040413 [Melastoma candidum]|uniref:Uncharacterized protein n=1 Tax=Melastoma candidum TaxID=119954 RepID=A0ACB9L545_9MYRT|nr:hypothetical protein MLD38_040413 [Melastoma candidum]
MGEKPESNNYSSRHEKGGMVTMPFILGSEACDKLAVVGFHANMITYLTTQLHLPLTKAANTLTNFGGTASLTPLLGAFVADSYAGRFWTIIVASLIYVLGMTCLTVSASLPQLRPPPCAGDQICQEANSTQLAILYVALLLGALGAGGIRPCVVAFGADQFDDGDQKQSAKTWNYFNWYYFVMGASVLLSVTVLVYVQDHVGWGWGLGVPTVLMFVSVIALIAGYRMYRMLDPAGSPFTRLFQVSAACFRKRNLPMMSEKWLLYENEQLDASISLGGTLQFRFLDNAAVVTNEDNPKAPNLWRLNTIHRVEELKTIIRMGPIWASGILLYTAYAQQGTFTLLQAKTMNRHLSPSFEIPAGSMTVFGLIPMMATIAIYDRFLVRIARRFTGLDRGITFLQRMGIGFFISILATLIAGFVEVKRKSVAAAHGLTNSPKAMIPISVFWLLPQYGLHGMAEAFMSIGHLEFFYDQAPESMRSTATALFCTSISAGNYLSTLVVSLVHKYSAGPNGSNWLPDNNLNIGKLEYFYWLLTMLQVINIIYYICAAKFYTFKLIEVRQVAATKVASGEEHSDAGVELSNKV